MQTEVLKFIHAGHQGIVKYRRRARESVWWLGLSTTIEKLERECPNCIEEGVNVKETFRTEDASTRPRQRIATDLCFCKNVWYLINLSE